MRKQILWIYFLFLTGCSAQVDIPLPKDHPAYGFYQTASAYHVAGSSCTKIKGTTDLRPNKIGPNQDYEKVRELAPGMFIVKDRQSGVQWLTVFFMEYGIMGSIPKTCSWSLSEFPIGNSLEPKIRDQEPRN